MGESTKIQWTDATWNPIGGCSIKSPGCSPCYAQRLAGTRLKNHPLYAGTTDIVKGKPVFNGKLTAAPNDHPVWTWPVRWRGAKAPVMGTGNPSLIFVGDMSDLFHEDRPAADADRVMEALIFSRHIGQLLTKRAEVMAGYFRDLKETGRWLVFGNPLFGGRPGLDPVVASFATVFHPVLWLGVSAERQKEFDERWPWLRYLAHDRGFTIFVSYEPALGPLILPDDFLRLGPRAQVIAGGMSGAETVPADPDWFRAVRDQCAAAGVAFFMKQVSAFRPTDDMIPDDLMIRQFPKV